MKTPVIFKVAGIITLIQVILSFTSGIIIGLTTPSSGEAIFGDNAPVIIILSLIFIAMIILMVSSILLIIGKKSARIIYLIGVILNLTGNIYVAGVGRGIQSSLITIVLCILLFTRKSAREYCSKNNNE
ncbi:MAG: hypothetical protein KBF12_01890 [Sebaldella sp.]|nr:hypothetical protein [Sebaldella sp.]